MDYNIFIFFLFVPFSIRFQVGESHVDVQRTAAANDQTDSACLKFVPNKYCIGLCCTLLILSTYLPLLLQMTSIDSIVSLVNLAKLNLKFIQNSNNNDKNTDNNDNIKNNLSKCNNCYNNHNNNTNNTKNNFIIRTNDKNSTSLNSSKNQSTSSRHQLSPNHSLIDANNLFSLMEMVSPIETMAVTVETSPTARDLANYNSMGCTPQMLDRIDYHDTNLIRDFDENR